MTQPDLDDLWDELHRGKVYECSLYSPKAHFDGLMEGGVIYIDPRSALLETLLHELLHRLKPRWGERRVRHTAVQLMGTMKDETSKRRWWAAYQRIKRRRSMRAVDD